MQDSQEDWSREAAKMHLVYTNAYLTIAATGARDSSGGLFFDREVQCVQARTVQGTWFGQTFDEMIFVDPDVYTKGIEKSTLYQRAWALQERYLSGRILHFGNEQLFWECRHLTACERLALGVKEPHRNHGVDRPTKMSIHNRIPFLPAAHMCKIWNEAVTRYSGCSITYVKDRLIAIGGLARTIFDTNQDQYAAAMWRKNLILQLPWTFVDPPHTREAISKAPQAPYIGPPWSWVTVDYEMQDRATELYCYSGGIGTGILRRHAPVKDMWVQTVNQDTFSQVSSGFVRIAGWLLDSDWFFIDTPSPVHSVIHLSGYRRLEYGQSWTTSSELDVTSLANERRSVLLMLYQQNESHEELARKFGLVVQLLAESPRPSFRRVGA